MMFLCLKSNFRPGLLLLWTSTDPYKVIQMFQWAIFVQRTTIVCLCDYRIMWFGNLIKAKSYVEGEFPIERKLEIVVIMVDEQNFD